MHGFNPFTSPPAGEIKQKINRLKKAYPSLTRRDLALKIIEERSRQCALTGLLSALPAIVPGWGTVLALLGGVALDITLMTYLLGRMVLEVAAVYRRDLTGYRYRQEAFWAFLLAAGAGSVGSSLSRTVAAQLSKEAFSALAERALISLGVRATARSSLLRIIPFLGLLLAGGVNYWVALTVGNRAIKYYEEREPEEWSGTTVDVEHSAG
ncbi:MAG TPA: hypothetical protein GXX25_00305 [Desulfotomaculum sp.]|nr:hypothetical protein [Desulfotomaculum sp.]